MNGDPVEVIADNLEQLEETVNVIRRERNEATAAPETVKIIATTTAPQTIIVAENLWQEHPEAYLPRVVVYVREKKAYYELLRDGQATGPWTASPEGRGFDFWIIDTDRMRDLGMSRAS